MTHNKANSMVLHGTGSQPVKVIEKGSLYSASFPGISRFDFQHLTSLQVDHRESTYQGFKRHSPSLLIL